MRWHWQKRSSFDEVGWVLSDNDAIAFGREFQTAREAVVAFANISGGGARGVEYRLLFGSTPVARVYATTYGSVSRLRGRRVDILSGESTTVALQGTSR
jgi:hypothetical protein